MYYHEQNVIPDLPYYHPDRTDLALDWTYHGRWCDIPRNRNHTGPAARGWRIARIEKYLDEEGRIKEAFAYGDDEKNILVWYDLEEFKRHFSNWIEPNPDKPPYENTRRFYKGLRIGSSQNKTKKRYDPYNHNYDYDYNLKANFSTNSNTERSIKGSKQRANQNKGNFSYDAEYKQRANQSVGANRYDAE